MERDPTESEAVASIGYEPQARMLEVEFTSGAVYRYDGVPADVFFRFRDAESKGRFFQAYIRPAYPYEKMRDAND